MRATSSAAADSSLRARMTTRRSVSTDLLLVAVATLLFGIQIVRLLQLDDSCGAYRMAAFEGMQNGD